jgi:hypothetical protein
MTHANESGSPRIRGRMLPKSGYTGAMRARVATRTTLKNAKRRRRVVGEARSVKKTKPRGKSVSSGMGDRGKSRGRWTLLE